MLGRDPNGAPSLLKLLESGAPRQRDAAWPVASAVLHGAIIALAATLGAREVVARAEPVRMDEIVFTTVPQPVTHSASSRSAPSPIAATRPPIDLSGVRLPSVVTTVPIGLPEPLAALPLSTLGTGLGDSGLAPGIPGGGGRVFDEHVVDRAVAPVPGNRAPDYPPMLRTAGVAGEVFVQFIVDAEGRVERSSLEIVRTTHALFAESVRRWLPATRYAPAEFGGAKVRQLVEQRIEFRLDRE